MTWRRGGLLHEEELPALPSVLDPVVEVLRTARAEDLTRYVPEHGQGRHSAVLVLFAVEQDAIDVLLIERSPDMRTHAGQPAFPGGSVEQEDADEAAAALREAVEETGLDPAGVRIFGLLPDLFVPVTNFVVSPVFAWWERPSEVAPSGEAASVHRVSVAELVDPANRCNVRHPSGYIGPGFLVRGMLVWGFTGGLLSSLFERVGWALPWDRDRIVDLPPQAPE